jgi:cyclohexanone monooxygenase
MDVREVDVVVVGAGFAGLYLHHKLRAAGFTIAGFEAGDGVGGTWYWNRYPGARCDVESLEYSYGFDEDLEQEWEWTERYATQPEILRYLEHVADRFDLRRDIRFETRVTGATWDEQRSRWTVVTDRDDLVQARFVVMATGCLSSTNVPDIPGLDSFAGPVLHTGQWPHEPVDLRGQRVGVIGTGSSGIQSIPVIAEQADHLTVFQRTANYSVPAWNEDLPPEKVAATKANYRELRAGNRQQPVGFGYGRPVAEQFALDVSEDERRRIYEERWAQGGLPFLGAFLDLALDPKANETAAEFVRGKIREIVHDPEVAEILTPKSVIGCKRLCVDTGYYATFNRPNVDLVDIAADPIVEITPTGVRTGTREVELDVLVLATGFDAMTGAVLRVDFVGRDGTKLEDAWSAGPRTYLGLGVPSFPNLFLVTGPGSPSVLTNMVTSIEQHVEWITRCLEDLRDAGHDTIEATQQAADNWVAYVNSIAAITLFNSCNSWYLGANVPGKPRIFMPLPGFPPYAEQCESVRNNGYEGFALG